MLSDADRRLSQMAASFAAQTRAPLGVAVSGGSDSLAMLVLLAEAGCAVQAVTVDHQLRKASGDEAKAVARQCAGLGISHSILTWDAPDQTGNLQDRARRARYRLMADWGHANGLTQIAIGHTQDDQAETFLMRLARGAGLDGLAAMSAAREDLGIVWQRPFLRAARADLRAVLTARQISWIEDPSNDDTRFDRVKARKALAELAPLGIDASKIQDAASHLADARAELDQHVRAAFMDHGDEVAGDLVLAPAFFARLGPETRRRALVSALRFVSGAEYPARKGAIAEALSAMDRGEKQTLSGCVITGGDGLRIAREFDAVKALVTSTDQLWDGRWQLTGDHQNSLEIRALGEAITDTPWRETGLPRASLLASPAIWRGDTLVAAPVAGLFNGWTAEATGRGKFADFTLAR